MEGTHNPNFGLLDWIKSDHVKTWNGQAAFRATPTNITYPNNNSLVYWETGSLTTEWANGGNGFKVVAGNYIESQMTLPDKWGAWPALWTWLNVDENGPWKNEIDSFEYHPDYRYVLELTSQKTKVACNYNNSADVNQGILITVGTHYGVDSVNWFINRKLVYSDHVGVPANWTAYINLNLGISAGTWHPPPHSTTTFIDFLVDYVRVYEWPTTYLSWNLVGGFGCPT